MKTQKTLNNPKTLSTKETSQILGKTEQFVRIGLQRGILPFGHAVMMGKEWSYVIYKKKLEEYVGELEQYSGELNERA